MDLILYNDKYFKFFAQTTSYQINLRGADGLQCQRFPDLSTASWILGWLVSNMF